MQHVSRMLIGFLSAGVVAGCDLRAPPDTRAADEKAIRDLEGLWAKAGEAGDVEKFLAFYADDACLSAPHRPAAAGTEDENLAGLRGLLERRRAERDEALAATRHAEGLDLLEKARAYVRAGKVTEAKLLAARAIGFEGLGRAESAEDFRRAHPALLRPESGEWQEARGLAFFEPELRTVWQTPARYRSPATTQLAYRWARLAEDSRAAR